MSHSTRMLPQCGHRGRHVADTCNHRKPRIVRTQNLSDQELEDLILSVDEDRSGCIEFEVSD
jgi:hypothetical protein